MAREPFCGNCGYLLQGLTESSKCPECGKPLVEVLERERVRPLGRRYRSPIVLFGLPLVDIALGPHENEWRGHAKGIVAIGDCATGWLALGGFARGIIAFGGMSIGLIAFGGGAIGGIALGGGALGGLALGGGAVGAFAHGGGVAGLVAVGGGAAGIYAAGGSVYARYALSPTGRNPTAQAFFDQLQAMFGLGSPLSPWFQLGLLVWVLGLVLTVASLCGLLLLAAYRRRYQAVR